MDLEGYNYSELHFQFGLNSCLQNRDCYCCQKRETLDMVGQNVRVVIWCPPPAWAKPGGGCPYGGWPVLWGGGDAPGPPAPAFQMTRVEDLDCSKVKVWASFSVFLNLGPVQTQQADASVWTGLTVVARSLWSLPIQPIWLHCMVQSQSTFGALYGAVSIHFW